MTPTDLGVARAVARERLAQTAQTRLATGVGGGRSQGRFIARWRRVSIQLVVAVLAALLLAAAVMPADIGRNSMRRVTITLPGTEAQHEMLKWALSRVDTLVGRVHDVEIRFHDTPDGCGGKHGLYNRARNEIEFCNTGLGETEPRHTMLHELIHAWSFEHLSSDQIDSFVALRGLDSWRADDTAWWQMGQEQAAEILAWGLMGDRPFPSKWTRWEPCFDMVAAFTLVTGTMPDRPLEECELEPWPALREPG